MRELAASLAIAKKLRVIKSIGWNSFFTGRQGNEEDADHYDEAQEDVDDDASEDDERFENGRLEISTDLNITTTVWVLRKNGRVRVKRTRW